MQGYYKDSESTNQVMVNGWYKTGDLGYLDNEGFLTLTGRCKNLIILNNGENVSPEELEADFQKYDEVQEVLVYEQKGIIVAEIYPNEQSLIEKLNKETIQEHFDNICEKINYNRVGMVKLRDSEFAKNTSKKIIRYKRKD